MQGLGVEARGKSLARGMGWGQEYGLGIKGWRPWVRTMAGNKGQGLRVGAWVGVGPGLWGGVKGMGWGSRGGTMGKGHGWR